MKKKLTRLSDILNTEIPSVARKAVTEMERTELPKGRVPLRPHSQGEVFHKDTSPQSVFDFLSLVYAWKTIVGDRMARFSIPLKLVRGTLTILCNHPAFAEQLAFVEAPLIAQIQNYFPALKGKIKSMRFFNNAELFDKEVKTKLENSSNQQQVFEKTHRFSPNFNRIKREAEDALGEMNDPEFRTLFASIFAQCLDDK